MPSLNISSPSVPALLTGLSPVAASPIAPVDGLAVVDFSSVIANLGQVAAPGAPPVVKPSVGTTLPPERPAIAGDPPTLPPLDVETVMIGSGGSVPTLREPAAETPPQLSVEPLPRLPVGAAPPSVIDTISVPPASCEVAPLPVDSGPVACGLQNFTLGGASKLTLARAIMRPLPGPLRLPPEDASDVPAPAAPALEHGLKRAFAEPMPAVLVEEPAPVPQPLPFAPVVEAPLPLPSPKAERDASTSAPAAPVNTTPAAPLPLPAGKREPQSPQLVPTPVSQVLGPLPQSFALPPEVARQVVQMVQAAVGEPVDRARDTVLPADAPLLADVSTPLPQPVAQPAAPLHAAFVPAQRPTIDTGHAEWMQSMIEKIAEMPQVDNRREAQIRLIPDALGPVSVKIQQHDDRMHVTLHAENPQARQLLSDAAPRLQEIAEVRGIRLTQASIGGGESHDRRPAPDHQPATPLRPRPAKAAADAESETPGDLIA